MTKLLPNGRLNFHALKEAEDSGRHYLIGLKEAVDSGRHGLIGLRSNFSVQCYFNVRKKV